MAEDLESLAKMFEQPNLVTVRLEDGGIFYVQEPLLCRLSDYFSKALNGNFEEGNSKTLRLPGCTQEIFKRMLYWLVTGDLEDESYGSQSDLVRLWTTGQMYLLPKLQNKVIDTLSHQFDHEFVDADAVALAFELTSEGSKLRNFFVTQLAEDCRHAPNLESGAAGVLESVPGLFKAFRKIMVSAIKNPKELEDFMGELDKFKVEEEEDE